jgi:hypothetical protein
MIPSPLRAKVQTPTDLHGRLQSLGLTLKADGNRWTVHVVRPAATSATSAASWRAVLTQRLSAVHFDSEHSHASIYSAGDHLVFSVSDSAGAAVTWAHPRHLCREAILAIAAHLEGLEKQRAAIRR